MRDMETKNELDHSCGVPLVVVAVQGGPPLVMIAVPVYSKTKQCCHVSDGRRNYCI